MSAETVEMTDIAESFESVSCEAAYLGDLAEETAATSLWRLEVQATAQEVEGLHYV